MTYEFVQDSSGIVILSGESEILADFSLSTLGGLLRFGISEMSFSFTQSATGELLWEPINAGTNPESWTQIDAGGTINQWTEKVV